MGENDLFSPLESGALPLSALLMDAGLLPITLLLLLLLPIPFFLLLFPMPFFLPSARPLLLPMLPSLPGPFPFHKGFIWVQI